MNVRNSRVIGHALSRYLERSQTFIYTQLRFQKRFTPVAFAEQTMNLNEFPLDGVHELVPDAVLPFRVIRRLTTFRSGFRNTYTSRLADAAEKHQCVALHAHFGWMGCLSLPAARRLNIPLVTTFYGRDLADRQGHSYDQLFAHGSLFVCEGPVMARHLESLGCPASRIRVVRIGLDLEQFPFMHRSRRKPLVVMQTARFVEKKGIDTTIRAYAEAQRSLGDSELWLVGAGPLRPELESLAETLGVAHSVQFVGELSHAEYRSMLDRVHICIQPSRVASDGDTEGGAPTVLLEMQASGIPVVATRHADIPFVVADTSALTEEDDVRGLAECLIDFAQAPDAEWHARTERGRAFVEREHSAQVVASQLDDVYREAISMVTGPA